MRTRLPTALILVPLLASGCPSPDERLLELSQESLERQATQNDHIASQSQETAEASRQLVEADAQARREMLEVHRELQAERNGLDRQHDELERERKQITQARHRDPIIANALLTIGMLIVSVLPLLVCIHLLRGLWGATPDEAVGELLIAELASETSALLPIDSPRLPAPGDAPRLAEDASPPASRLDYN